METNMREKIKTRENIFKLEQIKVEQVKQTSKSLLYAHMFFF